MSCPGQERYLSTGEAAARLGLSRHTLHRAVKRGDLAPALRTPGGYDRFHAADIAAYGQRLRDGPPAPPLTAAAAAESAGAGVAPATQPDGGVASLDLALALDPMAQLGAVLDRLSDGAAGGAGVPESVLSDLLALLTESLGVDLAFISRVDGCTLHLDAVYDHGALGLPAGTIMPLPDTYCATLLDGTAPALVIADTWADPHLAHLPSTRDLGVRSYAGVPLLGADGSRVGTLCTLHRQPRTVPASELTVLTMAARVVAYARTAAATKDHAERQAAELAAIIESLPDAVYISDAHSLRLANARALAMLGFTDRAELPQSIATLAARLDTRDAATDAPLGVEEQPLTRALRGEATVRDVRVRHRQTGRALVVRSAAAPIMHAGALIGAVVTNTDITAAIDLEQERERFLSSVSHDLKTPLTSVRGYTQLAQGAAQRLARTDTSLTRYLAEIDQGTTRLLGLIDELADATRGRLGQSVVLHRLPTDLVALVRGVVAQHAGLTAHRMHVASALPVLDVPIDAARLERVLDNLLTNALKYSPRGGDVRLRVTREGDTAVITVWDQGLGIPAADLPHLFTPFRRGRNVGQIAGTGLGLAGARDIVEMHEGTLTLESTEGVGTTVTLRLPLRVAVPVPTARGGGVGGEPRRTTRDTERDGAGETAGAPEPHRTRDQTTQRSAGE